jgi:hypothetical protein
MRMGSRLLGTARLRRMLRRCVGFFLGCFGREGSTEEQDTQLFACPSDLNGSYTSLAACQAHIEVKPAGHVQNLESSSSEYGQLTRSGPRH